MKAGDLLGIVEFGGVKNEKLDTTMILIVTDDTGNKLEISRNTAVTKRSQGIQVSALAGLYTFYFNEIMDAYIIWK